MLQASFVFINVDEEKQVAKILWGRGNVIVDSLLATWNKYRTELSQNILPCFTVRDAAFHLDQQLRMFTIWEKNTQQL